jgi:hypothetical protein
VGSIVCDPCDYLYDPYDSLCYLMLSWCYLMIVLMRCVEHLRFVLFVLLLIVECNDVGLLLINVLIHRYVCRGSW